jgi:hypothetical protein
MVVEADSIQLIDINCGSGDSNFILKDSMGNVVYSETISLKGSFTGIPDLSAKTEIKMWPNPVGEELKIRYSGVYRTEIRVEILDIMGKLVGEEVFPGISEGNEFSVKTGSLVSGIYVCRLSSAGQLLSVQKFNKK